MKKIIIYILITIVLTTVLTSCEPPSYLIVTNQTDQVLVLYQDELLRGKVQPGETIKITYPDIYNIVPLEARDIQGNVVFNNKLKRVEMKINQKILIKPNVGFVITD